MTYFGFLALFLGIPLAIISVALWLDKRAGKGLPAALSAFPAWSAVAIHVVVALVYTTPWDNYLVATGVWTYNPRLVTGVTLGWVPIEEYTFFVLQTVLTGSWLLFLARRIGAGNGYPGEKRRPWITGGETVALTLLGIIWLSAAGVLLSGWQPGTYLALILIWAVPPISLQIYFGANVLWRYRRLMIYALGSVTIYLAVADSLAIGSGTWTIAPDQSLNIYVGGVLPVEEFIFFLVTNTLIVFGITLLLSVESQARLHEIIAWIRSTSSSERAVMHKRKTLEAAREGSEMADR